MNNEFELNFADSTHYTFKIYNDKDTLVFEKTISSLKDFMQIIPQLKLNQQDAQLSPTEIDSLLKALTNN